MHHRYAISSSACQTRRWLLSTPTLVWCSVASYLQATNFISVVGTGSRSKGVASLWNSLYILFTTTHVGFTAVFYSAWVRPGNRRMCQIRDIVSYRTVPYRRGKKRLSPTTKIPRNLYTVSCYQYAQYHLPTRQRGNQLPVTNAFYRSNSGLFGSTVHVVSAGLVHIFLRAGYLGCIYYFCVYCSPHLHGAAACNSRYFADILPISIISTCCDKTIYRYIIHWFCLPYTNNSTNWTNYGVLSHDIEKRTVVVFDAHPAATNVF